MPESKTSHDTNFKILYSQGVLERKWESEIEASTPVMWVEQIIGSFPSIATKTPIPLYTPYTVLNFVTNLRNYDPTKNNELVYLHYWIWFLSNYKDTRYNQNLGNNKREVEYLQKRLKIINSDLSSEDNYLSQLEVLLDLKKLYREYDIETLKHSFVADLGIALDEENIEKIKAENLRIHRKFPVMYTRTCKDMINICNSDIIICLIEDKDPFKALYNLLTINIIRKNAKSMDMLFDDFYFKNPAIQELRKDYENHQGKFQYHQRER